jgi:hypothetical protein
MHALSFFGTAKRFIKFNIAQGVWNNLHRPKPIKLNKVSYKHNDITLEYKTIFDFILYMSNITLQYQTEQYDLTLFQY